MVKQLPFNNSQKKKQLCGKQPAKGLHKHHPVSSSQTPRKGGVIVSIPWTGIQSQKVWCPEAPGRAWWRGDSQPAPLVPKANLLPGL